MMRKRNRRRWVLIGMPVVLAGAVIALNMGGRASFTSVQAASPPVFTDMTGHWAADAVKQAVAKGYVDGYPDGTFKPDRAVTRAEFVAMLAKALRWQLPQANGAWYEPYVQAAVAQGVHRASDFASGDWNTPITRQDMMRLAVRATDAKYRDPKDATKDKYFVYAAAKKGLLRGVDDTGTLMPDGTTTRAQAVTVIERVLTLAAGGTLPVDKYAVNRAGVYAIKTNMFDVWPEVFGGRQMAGYDPYRKVNTGIWNPDDLVFETLDGKYKAEVEAILLIDWDDPKDPYRNLINPQGLYATNILFPRNSPNRYIPLQDVKNVYIFYPKTKVIYNKDTSIYATWDFLPVSLVGIEYDEQKLRQGIPDGAFVFVDESKKFGPPWFAILKNAVISDTVYVWAGAPAIPPYPNYSKTLLYVYRGKNK